MTYCKKIYDESQMVAGVNSIADNIIAHFPAGSDLAIVGIQQMGVVLAEKICAELAGRGREVDFGKVDITMHRDDIGSRNLLPMIRETEINFDVNGKDIILVDDVLSTGRTIRAALDALTDYGRPGLIRLAVLVDRGEPEFPIRADFAAFNISLPAERKVVVRFDAGADGEAGIFDVNWNQN